MFHQNHYFDLFYNHLYIYPKPSSIFTKRIFSKLRDNSSSHFFYFHHNIQLDFDKIKYLFSFKICNCFEIFWLFIGSNNHGMTYSSKVFVSIRKSSRKIMISYKSLLFHSNVLFFFVKLFTNLTIPNLIKFQPKISFTTVD